MGSCHASPRLRASTKRANSSAEPGAHAHAPQHRVPVPARTIVQRRQQATALLMHQQQLEELVGRLQHEQSERLQKGAFNAAQATEAAAQMVAASMLEDVAQAVRGGNGSSLGVGMGSRANGV